MNIPNMKSAEVLALENKIMQQQMQLRAVNDALVRKTHSNRKLVARVRKLERMARKTKTTQTTDTCRM